MTKNEASPISAIIVSVGVLLAAIAAGFAVHSIAYRPWFAAIALPIVFIGICARVETSRTKRLLQIAFLMLCIAACSASILGAMKSNIESPHEWDFLTFWLDGRVAAEGNNFYQSRYYYEALGSIPTSASFREEILDVGFRYPPPTMFLFLPLGLLDLSRALVFWYVLHSIFLIFSVFLLAKTFVNGTHVPGYLIAAVLVMILRPTLQTLWFAQTNFLVLVMILLFWRYRATFWGGIFLAVGILTKPVLVLMFAYLAIRRLWRSMMGVAVGGFLASVASVLVFGYHTFWSYFTEFPPSKMPRFVLSEDVNQSLQATILRLGEFAPTRMAFLFSQQSFLVAAAGLFFLSAWLIHKLGPRGDDVSLALMLTLALLVYPGTLVHYGVLLVVPLTWMWTHRKEIPVGNGPVAVFITSIYVIMCVWQGRFLFVAVSLTWAALVGIGWRWVSQPGIPTITQEVHR